MSGPEAPAKMRGISWHKGNRRWRVKIFHTRHLNLGEYVDPLLAASVYDVAARILKGPDARLNWPGKNPPHQEQAVALVESYLQTFQLRYRLQVVSCPTATSD